MTELIVVNDDTTREAQEAYVRRLMHQLAHTPLTWQTRARRADLRATISDELAKFNAYGHA